VLDLIPVKAGPNNIVSGPVMVRSDDNVFAKPGDILADPVMILPKIHLKALVRDLEIDVVEVFWEIK
jgi:hypothetical protein